MDDRSKLPPPYNKLTAEQVEEIKQLLSENVFQSEIAKRFDINQSDVSIIKNGKTYPKYVKLYVCGISHKTREVFANILANKGLKFSDFVKIKVHEEIAAATPKMKLPPTDF